MRITAYLCPPKVVHEVLTAHNHCTQLKSCNNNTKEMLRHLELHCSGAMMASAAVSLIISAVLSRVAIEWCHHLRNRTKTRANQSTCRIYLFGVIKLVSHIPTHVHIANMILSCPFVCVLTEDKNYLCLTLPLNVILHCLVLSDANLLDSSCFGRNRSSVSPSTRGFFGGHSRDAVIRKLLFECSRIFLEHSCQHNQ